MRLIPILIIAAISLSCARKTNQGAEPPRLTLSPSISQNSVSTYSSKASTTDFSLGDEVGVYGVLQGQGLRASQNRLDNSHFVVNSSSLLVGDPVVYYPDNKTPITLFAYYPYSANATDATNLEFAIREDQSKSNNLTLSDLCHARQDAMPSSTAIKLKFTHRLARVLINIVSPSATIAKVELLGAQHKVKINLTDGSTTATTDRRAICAKLTGITAEVIVPAQTFDASLSMLEITTSDARIYTYRPSTKTTLAQGATNTFNLSLDDSNTATLIGQQTITDWTTGTSTGDIIGRVKNSFTAHWVLPHKDYKSVNRVVLFVQSTATGATEQYSCSVKTVVDQGSMACSYTFDFEPTTLMEYPYRIAALEFYNNQSIVQRCESLVATSIYKSGAYTIGVRQDNILNITTGTIDRWQDVIVDGEIDGGGVNNGFVMELIEPWYDYTKLGRVVLTIGGQAYDFSPLGLDPSSNHLLAKSEKFFFPDSKGKIPDKYPFTITQVALHDATNAELASTYTNIEVGRGGLIRLQYYRGGVIAIKNALSDWGSADGSGVIIGGGTKNDFALRIVEFAHPISAVASVRFEVGAKSYTFANVTSANGSNQLICNSTTFSTPDAGGLFPLRYPFTISKVEVLDADGFVLQSSTGSVEVFDSRKCILQLYKNSVIRHFSSVGDWISGGGNVEGDVNFAGEVKSNVLRLYYQDALATNLAPCDGVKKMVLVIDGRDVTYSVVMSGNGSSAVSSSALNITDGTPAASRPVRYPYTITAVRLYDAGGSLLISRTLSTPFSVRGNGDVGIRIVR